MPPSGLLLSAKLAEILGVTPGDTVHVEVQESTRPTFDAVVAGTITDFAGVAAYIDIGALRQLMREGGTVSGAHLAVDMAQWDDLLAQAKKSPRIGTFTITRDARSSFDRTTGEMMGTVQAIYFCFAIIVAFGVVYNGARIALSERSRDLATLRVVGFTHREVATVLIGELALLTLLAIPPRSLYWKPIGKRNRPRFRHRISAPASGAHCPDLCNRGLNRFSLVGPVIRCR